VSALFKDHPLTDAERLWLEAVYEDSLLFDPKTARVRLHDKLPKGFDPKKIDGRFLLNGRKLTFLGISRIHPEAPIVATVERVIRKIHDLILEQPGIETFTAESLGDALGIDETEVGKALEHISTFGGFYSQASGRSDSTGFLSITLAGDNAYDAYLDFESLESLMEQYYESRANTSEGSGARRE